MMSAGRAVIFDCDGVLVDSEIIAIELEVVALAAAGVPLTADALAERFVGVSQASMTTAVHEEFGVELDAAWWADLHQRCGAALGQHVQPVAGIRTVLESLTLPACLASSSDHGRIALCLTAAGLIDHFPDGTRFSADDVRRGKPAPDLFLHAAAAMGWAPGNCLVVEDSPHGVKAAVAAGMDVVGFTAGGHAGASSWADRLHQAGATRVVATAEGLADALRAHHGGSLA